LGEVVSAAARDLVSPSGSTAALVTRAKCCDNGFVPPAPTLDHWARAAGGGPLPVECTVHAASPLSKCVQAENAKIYMCCASHNNELRRKRADRHLDMIATAE